MPRKGMRTVFFTSPTSPSTSTTPPHTLSDSFLQETIQIAESFVITDTDSSFQQDPHYAHRYIQAVTSLHSAMRRLVSLDSASVKLVHAHDLMRTAMDRLQVEFHRILSNNREYLYPESVSSVHSRRSSCSDFEAESEDEFRFADESILEVERVSMTAMADLKAIADCMIFTGYGRECVKVYKTVRKSIVDESLYNLGIERMDMSKVQKMDWEILEMKIKHWLKSVKTAVNSLFHGEKILCDYVFSTSTPIRESCFAEISKDASMILFSFPELVAKYKKSPEKIFTTLDLYEALAELWPEIEFSFSSIPTSMIKSQTDNSLIKLGENIRALLTDFETAIQKESSKSPVPKGGVHPLTRYVMNYLSFLSDYRGILNHIVPDSPVAEQLPLPESYYGRRNQIDSPITLRFVWLILVLLCKIDGKSEMYNDIALSYLFLANNLRYIVGKVRGSNLRFVLGSEWIETHETKVKEYVQKYKKMGWSEVLASLPAAATKMTAEEARECFRNFNRAFEETYRKQASWFVPEPKLRDEIKILVAKDLGGLYGEFYLKYGTRLGRVFWSDPVVRFSPDDLGNYLSDLFYGSGEGSIGSGFSSSRARILG